MPMKRSGRSVAAASFVIEIDEVFVASSVRGDSVAQRSFRILTLSFLVLGRRLDDEIAIDELGAVGGAGDALERGVAIARRHLLLLDQALEAAANRRNPAVHRRIGNIDHHDRKPGRGTNLRDAVPHGPCPDDANGLDHCLKSFILADVPYRPRPLFLHQGLAPPPGGCDLIFSLP
ncbi:hypothetical protein ACVWWO_002588 [Bradyrhizobium sp. F1.13.1]